MPSVWESLAAVLVMVGLIVIAQFKTVASKAAPRTTKLPAARRTEATRTEPKQGQQKKGDAAPANRKSSPAVRRGTRGPGASGKSIKSDDDMLHYLMRELDPDQGQ